MSKVDLTKPVNYSLVYWVVFLDKREDQNFFKHIIALDSKPNDNDIAHLVWDTVSDPKYDLAEGMDDYYIEVVAPGTNKAKAIIELLSVAAEDFIK